MKFGDIPQTSSNQHGHEDEMNTTDWQPTRSAHGLPDGETGFGSTDQQFEAKKGQWRRVRWESKRIYIGDPLQPYAQEQINRAGAEGWELVQIIGFDAWVKRKIVNG